MSRHKVRLLTLASVVLFVFLSCGLTARASTPRASSHAVVKLNFWSWVLGNDKDVALFNKTHPNIHVTWTKIPGGAPGYTKMFTALKAKTAPDDSQVEFQLLPTFESTGDLLDMSKYGGSALQSKFVPWTWKQVTLGGKVYAMPQDSGPEALYYRADIFQKYHLKVPQTWDDYYNDAVKLHKANPKYYITDYASNDPGWFVGLVWQAGGRWFRINGNSWAVGIKDSASTKVAAFWQKLLSKHLLRTDPDFAQAWYKDLQTGGAVTWPAAAWSQQTIGQYAANTSGKWRVALMPQWSAGQQVYGNWGGSTTVVFSQTKHPKEAAEFAKWLNTNSQAVDIMIKYQHIYPALQSKLGSPLVNGPQKFFGNQAIGKIFEKTSSKVDVNFVWGPTMNEVYSDYSDDAANAANGSATLPSVLKTLQGQTVTFMKKQGFAVKG